MVGKSGFTFALLEVTTESLLWCWGGLLAVSHGDATALQASTLSFYSSK